MALGFKAMKYVSSKNDLVQLELEVYKWFP